MKLDIVKAIKNMPRVNNIHIGELIKRIGLHALICPRCGSKLNATVAVKELFQLILETCKNNAGDGVGVTINKFGVFRAKWLKGRVINTPLTGTVQSRGGYVMRFKSSKTAKKHLNG